VKSKQIPDSRQALDQTFPGEWALGLTIVCSALEGHVHRDPDGTQRTCDKPGTRVLEKGHPANAAERFRIGLAIRDEHIDRIARHAGNVAIHLPANVIALDCDNTSAVELIARHALENTPQEHRTAASGERKAHYFFALPEGVAMKSKTGIEIPVGDVPAKLDIRGMTKTVVICAPSRKADGRDYRWTVPLPEEITDVPTLPDSLLHLLAATGVDTSVEEFQPVAGDLSALPGHDRLRTVVNRWAPRLRSIDELRSVADRAAARIYDGRPERLREAMLEGGEKDRLVKSAWEKFGGQAPLDEEMTDKGRALAHRTHFGEIVAFEPQVRKFFRWTGIVWEETPPAAVHHDFTALEERIFEDCQWAANGPQRDALATQSKALRSAAAINRATDMLGKLYQRRLEEYDAHPDLWVFADGQVGDLRAQKLGPPDAGHLLTRCAGARYVRGASSAQWVDFVSARLEDQETVDFLQRLVGMMMFGAGKEDVLPFLFGPGGTGKSTFVFVIRKVFGNYAVQGSFESIVSGARRNKGSATPDLWDWRGRRFVALDEIGEGARLDAIAKTLTGDEEISVRPLYGEQVVIPRTWSLLGQGNKEPEADPNDPGLQRRIIEIPFDVPVGERPKGERELKYQLTQPAVMEGVMQWCLEGNRAYQRDGLGTTPRLERAKQEFWDRQDVIGQWLESHCVMGAGLASNREELWGSFDAWQQAGLLPRERLTAKAFYARMRTRFGDFVRVKEAGKRYQKLFGVELLASSASPTGPGYVPGSTH